jgi:regulator of sigma E protease
LEKLLCFLLVILVVVFIHEFGHFFIARLCGVHVEVFSIGFGPALISFVDRKGTKWSISAIPLGGYVKLYGDDGDSDFQDKIRELSPEQKEKAFCLKPLYKQASIVFAGPFANYVLALVCFFIVFFATGIPTPSQRVDYVQEGSVASSIGLQQGDIIVGLNHQSIQNGEQFKKLMLEGSDEIYLKFLRKDKEFNVSFDVPRNSNGDRVLGIIFAISIEKASISNSIYFSFAHIYLMSKAMLKGLGEMIIGKSGIENIGGPLKIADYSQKAAQQDIFSFIFFIAVISLNLGLVNLMPIPMLDGGRLLFYMIEAIIRRPINKIAKSVALKLGLFILLALMGIAMFNDVRSLF